MGPLSQGSGRASASPLCLSSPMLRALFAARLLHLLLGLFLLLLLLLLLLLHRGGQEGFTGSGEDAEAAQRNARARRGADCVPLRRVLDPKGAPPNTTLTIVPDSCEGGLPHTVDAHTVAMPARFREEDVEAVMPHEGVHLRQRRAPRTWARVYATAWGAELRPEGPPPGLPTRLRARRRFNPDTAAAPWWVWRGRWWPVPQFAEEDTPSVPRAVVAWWDASTGAVHEGTPPPEWRAFFGEDLRQPEHPAEIAAEMVADGAGVGTPAEAALRAALAELASAEATEGGTKVPPTPPPFR